MPAPESLTDWLSCPTDAGHTLDVLVGRNGFEVTCCDCETTFSYTS